MRITTSRIFQVDASKLIFRDNELRSHLRKYATANLVQIDPKCFSLRRPPIKSLYTNRTIKYNPKAATELWYDQINTIKYQMINPSKKACRFYINFEASGKAGKSFSSAGISQIFNQFGMTNVSPSSMKDTFNSWLNDKLYISFEEAENDNYSDKEVNTFVKRWTSTNISSRAMREVVTTGKKYAIGVMTANDPGLYDLARRR